MRKYGYSFNMTCSLSLFHLDCFVYFKQNRIQKGRMKHPMRMNVPALVPWLIIINQKSPKRWMKKWWCTQCVIFKASTRVVQHMQSIQVTFISVNRLSHLSISNHPRGKATSCASFIYIPHTSHIGMVLKNLRWRQYLDRMHLNP